MKISIIGLGFVGNAMMTSFNNKKEDMNISDDDFLIYGYDKYKNGGIGNLNGCLDSDIIFTALPTLYDERLKSYDNSPTLSITKELYDLGYNKVIVIKSTVEPKFTENLASMYPTISFVHNPEFLTARTAYEDFHNQFHIILGRSSSCKNENYDILKIFYSKFYPNATISESTSTESECTKIYCNTFYAIKIQFFTELYCLSQKMGCDNSKIVDLMLKNNWINPMHTKIPGPDGNVSYGGLCFPKDTNALLEFMKKNDIPCNVLDACVQERNEMRNDHSNCNLNGK